MHYSPAAGRAAANLSTSIRSVLGSTSMDDIAQYWSDCTNHWSARYRRLPDESRRSAVSARLRIPTQQLGATTARTAPHPSTDEPGRNGHPRRLGRQLLLEPTSNVRQGSHPPSDCSSVPKPCRDCTFSPRPPFKNAPRIRLRSPEQTDCNLVIPTCLRRAGRAATTAPLGRPGPLEVQTHHHDHADTQHHEQQNYVDHLVVTPFPLQNCL